MSEGPQAEGEPRVIVRGPAALLVLRLRDLPPGEYVIHLDKTHPTRWRWRPVLLGAWERPRHDLPQHEKQDE